MRELTYAQALNEALRQAMERDDSVIVMGEDVGRYGGIFQVTAGLLDRFGESRVIDTPISESGFVGMGVGMAATGLRPVAELMFIDFTTVAMDQIVNQAAKMHYMFGGRIEIPLVIRVNIGAGRGTAAQHSQSLHAWFVHAPGIKVVLPSNPYDAKGLLLTAIEDPNPVLFVEHKMLYAGSKGEVPEEYYTVPFGQAKVVRTGSELTIVATSSMVAKAVQIAEEYKDKGLNIEVIDPVTLVPLDKETLLGSVRKTGRLIVADEGYHTCGVASEIAAIVADEALEYLQAPVKRVTSPDIPVPFSPPLEKFHIPDLQNIRDAIEELRDYF